MNVKRHSAFAGEDEPRDRTVDIRVRLALSAEIPTDVELLPFPAEVRARVPEVEGYRYIVARDDVVIVDPRNRDAALVISEWRPRKLRTCLTEDPYTPYTKCAGLSLSRRPRRSTPPARPP